MYGTLWQRYGVQVHKLSLFKYEQEKVVDWREGYLLPAGESDLRGGVISRCLTSLKLGMNLEQAINGRNQPLDDVEVCFTMTARYRQQELVSHPETLMLANSKMAHVFLAQAMGAWTVCLLNIAQSKDWLAKVKSSHTKPEDFKFLVIDDRDAADAEYREYTGVRIENTEWLKQSLILNLLANRQEKTVKKGK